MRAIVCRLDTMWCAVPVAHVDEVMRARDVAPLVDGPAAVSGLALIRGRFVPLIDLSLLLLGRAAPVTRWLSLRMRDRSAAIAVGGVLGISDIEPSTLAPWPVLMAGTRTETVEAFAARDQQLLAILSLSRVVSALPQHLERAVGP